jgi:hypothetical protein
MVDVGDDGEVADVGLIDKILIPDSRFQIPDNKYLISQISKRVRNS